LRVAFAGTPEFALPALQALCAHHQVLGVLTQPDRPRGRGRTLGVSPVKAAALARGLPLDQPLTLRNAAGRAALAAWAPEALIVVAYGLLLPPEVLSLPRYGCLNIHASLLPRWRGAAPIQRAILAGDAQSGVTIMQMDAGLDTGPVLLQSAVTLGPRATGGSLTAELAALGARALLEALAGLAAGTLTPRPQPQSGVSYAAKIEKSEARIDWSGAATAIERQVRAFNPVPIAETLLDGQQLRIHAARVGAETDAKMADPAVKSWENGSIIAVRDDYMLISCGEGTLAATCVQLPGRRPVSVRDFSHGRTLMGRRLG
jgi:methionyl-tRNA formyltransferase